MYNLINCIFSIKLNAHFYFFLKIGQSILKDTALCKSLKNSIFFFVQMLLSMLILWFCMIESVQKHFTFPNITFPRNKCLYISKESDILRNRALSKQKHNDGCFRVLLWKQILQHAHELAAHFFILSADYWCCLKSKRVFAPNIDFVEFIPVYSSL